MFTIPHRGGTENSLVAAAVQRRTFQFTGACAVLIINQEIILHDTELSQPSY